MKLHSIHNKPSLLKYTQETLNFEAPQLHAFSMHTQHQNWRATSTESLRGTLAVSSAISLTPNTYMHDIRGVKETDIYEVE